MKFLFAFTALLAVAFAQESCDDCSAGTQVLVDYLMTDEEIAKAVELLQNTVCQGLDDPAGCGRGVAAWWPDMAKTLLSNEKTVPGVCAGIGACSFTRAWGCDSCQDLVGQVGDIIRTDYSVEQAVALWKGDAFCGASADPDTCGTFVDAIAAPAINAVGEVLRVDAERFCADVYNIC